MKNILNMIVHTIVCTLAGVFFILLCMYHSSCHITPEGIKLVSDGITSVKIKEYSIDEGLIQVWFSKKVEPESVFAVESDETCTSIENFLNHEKKMDVDCSASNDNSLRFTVRDKTQIGKTYDLFACVKDTSGNTLSFTIPFYGENRNFPVMVISEVSDFYSRKDGICEYIELYAVTSGNLFGLELISASDDRHFALPCAEVRKGDYVIVHLRNESESCISETGDNLSLSRAKGSVNGVRDIWIDNDQSVLNSTAEILMLKNKARSVVTDCVMYCRQDYALENEKWKSEKLCEASEICLDYGLWHGEGKPSDAVYSMKRKTTSYISRTNIKYLNGNSGVKNSRDNWIGTAKSKTTPGGPNMW